MASIPTTVRLPAAADPTILHPLDRLRGTVRRYVVLDGLLAAALFVLAWFWAGLALDFGLFKLTTFDWALDAPWGLRAVALGVALLLLVILVTRRVVLRLTRELSYPSLALVLEKRFPAVLGDRLITAVELADVPAAERVGYSGEMVRQTVVEARERVGRVPVDEVFNWRRLRVGLLVLFGAGVLLAAGSYALAATVGRTSAPAEFAWRFADVAAIWAERNLLLRNTPWPRRAHLELVGFDGRELRVGKDAPPPKVRVRAYEWVIADASARAGWRPLRWADLTPEFVGVAVPRSVTLRSEDDWRPADIASAALVGGVGVGTTEKPVATRTLHLDALTVDEVAAEVSASHPETADVFARLDELSADPAMSRTLRRLTVPDAATLSYRGRPTDNTGTPTGAPGTTRGDIKLTREPGGDFTGDVVGLKESVGFVVRAEDFRTEWKDIVLVPPPMLTKLSVAEWKPAYLFHPAPVDPDFPDRTSPEALRGLRQAFAEADLTLTGEKSVWSVPAGTELTLTAIADKPLTRVVALPRAGRLPGAAAGSAVPVEVRPDGDRFTLRFEGTDRIAETSEFELVLTDADGVTSRRGVLLQAAEDLPPTVDVAVDVIRRVGNTYMCTPIARVPFVKDSIVRDDTGLSGVEYRFAVTRLEAQAVTGIQTQALAGVWAAAPALPSLGSAVGPAASVLLMTRLGEGEQKQAAAFPAHPFTRAASGLPKVTLDTLKQALATPPARPDRPDVVREVRFNPDADAFDLSEADDALERRAVSSGRPVRRMLVTESGAVQPRFRVELTVAAIDANVETGPRQGQNLEPLVFLVVSEADLLAEISKDEEVQIARLDDAIRKLAGAADKLARQSDKLLSPAPPPEVVLSARVGADDVIQDVGKARDQTQGIIAEYTRLRREVEANRCNEEPDPTTGLRVSKVARRYDDTVIRPLGGVLTAEFKAAEDALAQFREPLSLEPGRAPDAATVTLARSALQALILKLQMIREQSGKDLSLNKLRDDLRKILENQDQVSKALDRIKRGVQAALFSPKIQPTAPVLLAAGEKRTIKHAVDWNIYDKGELKVKVVVPEGSGLTAPGEITVADDKNEFGFDLTAGTKPGEYAVKVVPEVGEAVEVKVTVK